VNPFAESITLDQLLEDPYPVYRRLRAETPVAWVPAIGTWMVSRWDDVRQVLGSSEALVSVDPVASNYAGPTNVLTSEGDAHGSVRASFDDKLARETVPPLHDELLPYARQLAGRLDGAGADALTGCFEPLAAEALRRMLGVPEIPADVLSGWSRALNPGFGEELTPEEDRTIRAACADIDSVFAPLVAERTSTPDGSLLSGLIHAGRPPGEPRAVADVLATIKVLVLPLLEVVIQGGNTLHALLSHPDQLDAVRKDPDLLAHAVHEGLRWNPAVACTDRVAVRPMTIAGTELPAGASITVLTSSANRDERICQDGEVFDIRRTPGPFLTFGYAHHRCAARFYVPRIVEAGLAALIERAPVMRLSDGEPSTFRGWRVRMPDRLIVEFG